MIYEYFYKEKYQSFDELNNLEYDYFISGYNPSDRVLNLFDKIKSKNKYWVLFKEYNYSKNEYPNHPFFVADNCNEGEVIRELIEYIQLETSSRICVDITGFIRPYLAFLIRYFYELGIKKVDFIYTDPIAYKAKEKTTFSSVFNSVEQIEGYKGGHSPDTNNDYLIIGAGYDSTLIQEVSAKKNKTKKILLFGFPSIQADMFQENILKAYQAEEATGKGDGIYIDETFCVFSPANDPFITAEVLSKFIQKEDSKKKITNLYLSPLSTKAQVLGMCLYYIFECIDSNVSMIFPFCETYEKITSTGVSKIWVYNVEFPS